MKPTQHLIHNIDFFPYLISTNVSVLVCYTGLGYVPYDIPKDTLLLDLQSNRITEIREGDFKGMTNLYVRPYISLFHNLYHRHICSLFVNEFRNAIFSLMLMKVCTSFPYSYFPIPGPGVKI